MISDSIPFQSLLVSLLIIHFSELEIFQRRQVHFSKEAYLINKISLLFCSVDLTIIFVLSINGILKNYILGCLLLVCRKELIYVY